MKKIALGSSDFKEIIDKNYYFVDKTLIIKELLEDSSKIILLPRPRRFGKTLNMSIIRYFLEKTNEETGYLFHNLKIEKEKEIMKKQGKYPLIYMTFKDDKHNNFHNFIESFRMKVSDIYKSFGIICSDLEEVDKKYFNDILNKRSSITELEMSILKLSEYLNIHYNEKVILLIDEYDTPIHNSYFEGHYDETIGFIRNFLSAALKDNINLEKSLITGILRVAKESIFSGLNNLEVYSILGERYSDKFGFTEEEVKALLKYYNSCENLEDFKRWYNGYIFGNTIIYNPWSVLSYLNKPDRNFMPYWVNTSENRLIKEILVGGDERIKSSLEELYTGGMVETTINEDVVMEDITLGRENLWSFLLLSGYLKVVDKSFDSEIDLYKYKLKIPNIEIKTLYRSIIDRWFKEANGQNDYENMIEALITGDVKSFSKIFKRYVLESFSYFDVSGKNPERVYHAFVLGIMISLTGIYEVVSNRESGLGRYDVSLIPKDNSKVGYIFEFKRYDVDDEETIEEALDDALKQIINKKYDTELISRGVKNIVKMAIVFNGKNVHIRS